MSYTMRLVIAWSVMIGLPIILIVCALKFPSLQIMFGLLAFASIVFMMKLGEIVMAGFDGLRSKKTNGH